MKNGIILFAVLAFAACSGPANPEITELESRRDSLLAVELDVKKQINEVEAQLRAIDSTVNPDDIKIIKQITMQKNNIAKFEKKIKELEGKMTRNEVEHLTAVAIKNLKGETFNHYLIAYGRVEADDYALVSPEMGGRVRSIHVEEGDVVSKGALLVSLNTESVAEQIKSVQSNLELAQITFEKQDTLYKQGIGSEINYLAAKSNMESLEAQLEALQAQKRMSEIRAPFAGTVNKIFPKIGELASPGMPVVEMVNLGGYKITADISEKHIGEIRLGEKVEVTFDALKEDTIHTPIVRVGKVIDQASRTFEIGLKISSYGTRIKPNMVSTIRINDYSAQNAMVVPSLVIRQNIDGSNYLYVVEERDGAYYVAKREIKTGHSYDARTEITEGLKQGDKVVVKGFNTISSGQKVEVTNS